MQKPRRKALLVIRNLLTCTMCSMALVAVLSVPVQVFPSSRDVPIFSRSYKLPKVITDLQFISRLFFLSCLFNCIIFYSFLFISVAVFFFLLISSSSHCFLLLRVVYYYCLDQNRLYTSVLDFFTSELLFLVSYSFFITSQADCVVETLFGLLLLLAFFKFLFISVAT